MHWLIHRPRWFGGSASGPPEIAPDPIGERLRSVVAEHARAKETCARSYQMRVQGMIDELFLKMEEGHARHDS